MPQCSRCQRATYDCPVCKGSGRYGSSHCTECGGTGQLCPDHGKHWK